MNEIINTLSKGDIINISFGSVSAKNQFKSLKVKCRNKVRNGKIDKITFTNLCNPNGIKFYGYERGNGKWGFAKGDLGIHNIKLID